MKLCCFWHRQKWFVWLKKKKFWFDWVVVCEGELCGVQHPRCPSRAGAVPAPPVTPGGSGRLRAQGFPFPDHNRQGHSTAGHSPSPLYGILHRGRALPAAGCCSRCAATAGAAPGAAGTHSSAWLCGTTAPESPAQIPTILKPLVWKGWIFIDMGYQNATVLLMSKRILVLPGLHTWMWQLYPRMATKVLMERTARHFLIV